MKSVFKFDRMEVAYLRKRGAYKTKQRGLILECVECQGNQYVTIGQISDFLQMRNCKVGQTTIYRTLDILVKEKKIAKVFIDGVKGACYRYMSRGENHVFFSMKCEKCGEVMDIECSELEKLYVHLAKDHHLKVYPEKTMFYGICDKCREVCSV